MVETLKYASISIDEVIASKLRLEANVFNVKARKAKEVLKACKWELKTICGKNGLADAFRPNIVTRIFVPKTEGIPMYTPSQFMEMYPKPTKYLSKATKTDLSKWYVKQGQLLLSCSGTIGKVTVVSRTLNNKLFSQNLIQLTPHKKEDIGFIYTFIITDTGQQLLNSNLYGAVIQHIDPNHLDHIPIPNPTKQLKEKIHSLIIESFKLRDDANDLVDKAENLLIENLKLPAIEKLLPDFYDKKSEVKTFTVKLDSLNNRFDGSYHNPIVSSILDYFLDNAETIKPLSHLVKEITMPGIFKRVYVGPDEGVPFLGTDDILEISPRVEKFLSKKIHKKLIEKELKLQANTILQSNRGSVSVGRVAFVPEYYEKENWVASQNILRIVPIDLQLAGYLYIFLNSEYGNILSRREIYGSTIDMIDPHNTAQIPIPLLKDKKAMSEINQLALKANTLRTKAYYLEKEAIKLMNEEVIFA